MTGIDEGLARDVAAVTGGVVVTESDPRDARDAVSDRLDRRLPLPVLRTAGVAAAAVVALVAVGAAFILALAGDDQATQLAGPGAVPPDQQGSLLVGTPPTAQLLDGVWRLDNGRIVMRFDEKGTVTFDDQGTLFSAPGTTASYAIVGDQITVTTTNDDQAGCIGTKFALRASFAGPGAMRFVGSDPFSACAPLPPGPGVLEQVLPTSRSGAELVFSEDVGWKPLTDRSFLRGVWLAEGGGHVLEMDPDGAYYIADSSGEPIDSGQWSLRDARLTLTSSAVSTTCSEGAQFALGSVEGIAAGTRTFRGTVAENTCGGAWTPPTWFLIPNASASD